MGLTNNTTFPGLAVPVTDLAGREQVALIVKATFDIDARGHTRFADEQSVVRPADELFDPSAANSSARYPSDIALEMVGTSVVVVGEAVSPRPVEAMDVGVKVRDTTVPLRVHGERRFYRAALGIGIGPAARFERMPIVYERAFGGASPDHRTVEVRNPAGLGAAASPADLIDTPAPQIEHPARPHTSARDKHPPAGFGAILPHWSPRREYAGTYDDVWQQTRMPLFPLDFDARYYAPAHPSLLFDPGLRPGDPIAVVGMSEEPLVFQLPRLPIELRGRSDLSGWRTVLPVIDTVLVEPGRRRVELTCRAAFLVGRGKDILRELVVELDDAG